MTTATRGTEPAGSTGPDGRVTVSLIGSTGSIGTQAIDVISRYPDRFTVTGLSAGGADPVALAHQAAKHCALPDAARKKNFSGRILFLQVFEDRRRFIKRKIPVRDRRYLASGIERHILRFGKIAGGE